MSENNDKGFNKSVINWYPGHMAKTKRLIKENINLIDIIYEVVDSRVPISSKVKDIDTVINNKPRILIMTKYDLCDKEETQKFINYYTSLGYTVLKYDLINNKNANEILEKSNIILKEKQEKLKLKGICNTSFRALVIGAPNVGKSTLINKIVGKKSAITGNKPGVTKQLNWIRVGKNIELLDSPGILWPKLDNDTIALNLASTTAIKEEILEKEEIAIYILNFLNKYYKNILKEYYKLDNITDIYEALNTIGKNKGCLAKGGIVNTDKVVDIIINDIKQGKIKGITFDRYEDIK